MSKNDIGIIVGFERIETIKKDISSGGAQRGWDGFLDSDSNNDRLYFNGLFVYKDSLSSKILRDSLSNLKDVIEDDGEKLMQLYFIFNRDDEGKINPDDLVLIMRDIQKHLYSGYKVLVDVVLDKIDEMEGKCFQVISTLNKSSLEFDIEQHLLNKIVGCYVGSELNDRLTSASSFSDLSIEDYCNFIAMYQIVIIELINRSLSELGYIFRVKTMPDFKLYCKCDGNSFEKITFDIVNRYGIPTV